MCTGNRTLSCLDVSTGTDYTRLSYSLRCVCRVRSMSEAQLHRRIWSIKRIDKMQDFVEARAVFLATKMPSTVLSTRSVHEQLLVGLQQVVQSSVMPALAAEASEALEKLLRHD